MRLDAHFDMLPERAFQKRGFGQAPATLEGGGKGGGGGSAANQTVTTSNIPDWARPGMESLIHSGMQSVFPNMTPVYDEKGKLKSYNLGAQQGYSPFNANATTGASQQALDAARSTTAGFDPLQLQVMNEARNMQTPGQFGTATGLAGAAGRGGLESVGQAYGYGGMGAGYGQQGADLGMMGLRAEQTGNQIGRQAQNYARQAAQAGQQYAQQATNPYAMQAYIDRKSTRLNSSH